MNDLQDSRPISLARIARKKSTTDAFFIFDSRHHKIFELFFFTIDLATKIDRQRMVASSALAKTGDKEYIEKWELLQQTPDPTFKHLQRFSSLNSENLIIRTVDNFIHYLSRIIQSAMAKRPELLISRETVRLDEIVQFEKRRHLIEYLIERKLNELTYGGVRGISSFLEERLGVSISSRPKTFDLILLAVELRNLYTHNNGIVNTVMIRRLASVAHDLELTLGKRVHSDFDTVCLVGNAMYDTATWLDDVVSKKFRLKRRQLSSWANDTGAKGGSYRQK